MKKQTVNASKSGKRILSVTIKHIIDENPDTSWLGEYSDTAETEFAIERRAYGQGNQREFRYFNGPVDNYKGESPEDIRKYVRQDYSRMESLNRGDWCFIGIRAEAEVQLAATWENSVVSKVSWHSPIAPYQTITSGGFWGIESDSEDSYIKEEEQNQLSELRAQLKALGFNSRAISCAFQNIERKDS